MPSYAQRLRLPGWLFLDQDRRLLATLRAPDARRAVDAMREAAKTDGSYFGRVVAETRWIRRIK